MRANTNLLIGRVGVSWVANAYLEDKTFKRLITYLEEENKDKVNKEEAINIENVARQKLNDLIKKSKERRMQREKEQQEEE